MNLYPFNTAAGQLFKRDSLQKDLMKAYSLQHGVYFVRECPYAPNMKPSDTIALVGPGSTAPPFKHPFFLDMPAQQEGGIVFIDGRGFTRDDRAEGSFKVSNQSEYTLEAGRAFLILCGRTNGGSVLMNFSDLPAKVFAQWLTDRINAQLNLSLEEQMSIKALAAWFHICQYYDADSFQGEDQKRAQARAMRAAGMDGRLWETAVGKKPLEWGGTIDLFCQQAKEIANGSVRLEGLKRQFVTEVTVSTFRGAQTRELMAVALENPPSWIAVIERCVSEFSFYKRFPLGEAVNRNAKTPVARKEFLQALSRLPF